MTLKSVSSHRGNTKRKPSYQKPKIRRYTTRSSSSAILDTKQPSKTTFNPEVEVFGTKLGHYGVRGVPSEPKIIPDVLPIERSYDTIKKVSLPSSREPVPTFMFLDSYQRILDSVHLGLDDDEGGPDNSRDSAVNFVSASARFTKKPFLKQLDLAKRMAREKANRALGLKNTSVPNLSDLSQGQLI